MEKPEGKKEQEKLLTPDMISGKFFETFKKREDVRKWMESNALGLVNNAFVSMMKTTLDNVAAVESQDAAKEVAKYMKDDMDFNTRIFGDPEKETALKIDADNYLNETYLKPEEQEGTKDLVS